MMNPSYLQKNIMRKAIHTLLLTTLTTFFSSWLWADLYPKQHSAELSAFALTGFFLFGKQTVLPSPPTIFSSSKSPQLLKDNHKIIIIQDELMPEPEHFVVKRDSFKIYNMRPGISPPHITKAHLIPGVNKKIWLLSGPTNEWYLYSDFSPPSPEEYLTETKALVLTHEYCPILLTSDASGILGQASLCDKKALSLWAKLMKSVRKSLFPIVFSLSRNDEGILMVTCYMPGTAPITLTADEYRWMKSLFYESIIDAYLFGGPDFINGPHWDYYQKIKMRKPDQKEEKSEHLKDGNEELKQETNQSEKRADQTAIKSSQKHQQLKRTKIQLISKASENTPLNNVSNTDDSGSTKSDSLKHDIEKAIETNDLAAIHALLENNTSITDDNEFLDTLALSALFNHRFRVLELLIKHGAQLPSRYSDLEAAMLRAMRSDNYKAFDILLGKSSFQVEKSESLHKTMLNEALRLHSTNWLRHLLNHQAARFLETRATRQPILDDLLKNAVVKSRSTAFVNILLEEGATPNAIIEDTGVRLLAEAAQRGNIQLVKCLHTHGANLEAGTTGKQTPLSQAVKRNDRPMVELLVSLGADINGGNENASIPLTLAIERRHPVIARRLRERGASASREAMISFFGYDPAEGFFSLEERCYREITAQLTSGNWQVDALPLPPGIIHELKIRMRPYNQPSKK